MSTYGDFIFHISKSTNEIMPGTSVNDFVCYAPSNTQKVFIGSSNASNILIITSSNTGTSNMSVTGNLTTKNLTVTGTVTGITTVGTNVTTSNVYSSNVYTSNLAISESVSFPTNFNIHTGTGNVTANGVVCTNFLATNVTASTIMGNLTGIADMANSLVINPTLMGTVTADAFSGAHSGNGSLLSNLNMSAPGMTGTLAVAQGGTGATTSTGTGNVVRNSNATFSYASNVGTFSNSGLIYTNQLSNMGGINASGQTIIAGTFSGSGTGLTSIPGAQVTGTVASATTATTLVNNPTLTGTITGGTFSGTHTGDGSGITNIAITNITGGNTGTGGLVRSNAPVLSNASNVGTFSNSGGITSQSIGVAGNGGNGYIVTCPADGNYAGISKSKDTIIYTHTGTQDSGGITIAPWTLSTTKGLRVDGVTGYVGIGTATPAYKLDVNGSFNCQSMTQNVYGIFRNTSAKVSMQPYASMVPLTWSAVNVSNITLNTTANDYATSGQLANSVFIFSIPGVYQLNIQLNIEQDNLASGITTDFFLNLFNSDKTINTLGLQAWQNDGAQLSGRSTFVMNFLVVITTSANAVSLSSVSSYDYNLNTTVAWSRCMITKVA